MVSASTRSRSRGQGHSKEAMAQKEREREREKGAGRGAIDGVGIYGRPLAFGIPDSCVQISPLYRGLCVVPFKIHRERLTTDIEEEEEEEEKTDHFQ